MPDDPHLISSWSAPFLIAAIFSFLGWVARGLFDYFLNRSLARRSIFYSTLLTRRLDALISVDHSILEFEAKIYGWINGLNANLDREAYSSALRGLRATFERSCLLLPAEINSAFLIQFTDVFDRIVDLNVAEDQLDATTVTIPMAHEPMENAAVARVKVTIGISEFRAAILSASRKLIETDQLA